MPEEWKIDDNLIILTTDLQEDETWLTIKETVRRLQSWGWSRFVTVRDQKNKKNLDRFAMRFIAWVMQNL